MKQEDIIKEYLKFKEKCIEAKMFDLDEIKWLFEVTIGLLEKVYSFKIKKQ